MLIFLKIWGILVFISFLLCIIVPLYRSRKRYKKYYPNPIGWFVKYWIEEEMYFGTVVDIVINYTKDNEVIIETPFGKKQFFIKDTVPLFKQN